MNEEPIFTEISVEEQTLFDIRNSSDYKKVIHRFDEKDFCHIDYVLESSESLNKKIKTQYIYEDIYRDGELTGLALKNTISTIIE